MKFKTYLILPLIACASAVAQEAQHEPSGYTDQKAVERWQVEAQRQADAKGDPSPRVYFPKEPKDVLYKEFEMPPTEMLPNCFYDRGNNFPTECLDGKTTIFHAERDSQEDLDRLKKNAAKMSDKYNVMPSNYHEEAAALRKKVGLPPYGEDIGNNRNYNLIPESTDYRSKADKQRQASRNK